MTDLVCNACPDSRPGAGPDAEPATPREPFSLAMGVFGLLTAEYLPASLLTPMATELGVSEALAGQAVTVTAVVALSAGLLVPGLTRSIDRRWVLLGFSTLDDRVQSVGRRFSSFAVLLLMRILLGIALGGFWSMAAAVALIAARLTARMMSSRSPGVTTSTPGLSS